MHVLQHVKNPFRAERVSHGERPLRVAEAEHYGAVEVLRRGDAHLHDIATDVDDVRHDTLRHEARRILDDRHRHAVARQQPMRLVAHFPTGDWRRHDRAALAEAEERIERDSARGIELVLERGRGSVQAERCHKANRFGTGLRLDFGAEAEEQLLQLRNRPDARRFCLRCGCLRRHVHVRCVLVPAALGLAAKQSGGDARLGDEGGPVFRLLEVLLVHRLHHGMGDVEPDEVHEAEGSDAEAGGVHQDAVDRGVIRDTFGEDAK